MEEKKPDGWVAFDEVSGVAIGTAISQTPAAAIRSYCEFSRLKNEHYKHAIQRAMARGIRPRPVKLVFLDEPTDGGEG
jgi:hypothetical protein